jgi:hypothetical protein
MADAPIVPLDYLYGVKVVDIGDARVKRGKSRRPIGTCAHKSMHYDQEERRVWCADCEATIEAFDAFTVLVENFDRQVKRLQDRENKIVEAEAATLVSRAARVMDAEWRKHKTVPLCPHCSEPLLPEDIVRGVPTRARSLTTVK